MGRPKIQVYDNLWDILRRVEELRTDDDKHTIYRGHSSSKHKLSPGIFRDQNKIIRSKERAVLRELITKHPQDFSNDIGTFEKLVRMQHYGLPTRLLDVTYNPLVAAYFACEVETKDDAEIIVMRVDRNRFKSFDSDTVRCLSNLANLSSAEIEEIDKCTSPDELNTSDAGKRLHDFITQERPNFQPKIEKKHLDDFYLVNPKLNNPRIQAQNGAFLIFGLQEEIKSKTNGFSIEKIRINKKYVSEIRKSIELLGFTESTIYPELSKTADVIRKKYGVAPPR